MWVWSGNTTIANRRQTHDIAMKSHTTTTRHKEDTPTKATSSLFPSGLLKGDGSIFVHSLYISALIVLLGFSVWSLFSCAVRSVVGVLQSFLGRRENCLLFLLSSDAKCQLVFCVTSLRCRGLLCVIMPLSLSYPLSLSCTDPYMSPDMWFSAM